MKNGDIVFVKGLGESKKAKINWVKDEKAGISYTGKGQLGTSNVVDISELTVIKKSRGFKYNDIVRHANGKARVNWVENGDVGITYLSPKEMKGGASVVGEASLSLISASAKDEMAERIASITDIELEKHIMSIRGRRAPRPSTQRRGAGQPKVAREKKVSFDDLFKKMEENPNK